MDAWLTTTQDEHNRTEETAEAIGQHYVKHGERLYYEGLKLGREVVDPVSSVTTHSMRQLGVLPQVDPHLLPPQRGDHNGVIHGWLHMRMRCSLSLVRQGADVPRNCRLHG